MPARILPKRRYGFSLVEVLAAVAIIGIITFLAIPNIIRMRQDSEVNLVKSRAEALHLAMASFVQAQGIENAKTLWANKNDQERYALVQPYLGFSDLTLSNYIPSGYSISFPSNIHPLTKVILSSGNATIPLD
jgi:prepilin-type N-terminal cleavage/methylation domain-containing protein